MKAFKILTYLIAAVWFVNGLLCKVLNFVPRHRLIVSRILGEDSAGTFTIVIGVAEILMALWIISTFKIRLCAAFQIIVIATMNVIEFILVPDLLLWGKANALFASLLIIIIYYYAFILNKTTAEQSLQWSHP